MVSAFPFTVAWVVFTRGGELGGAVVGVVPLLLLAPVELELPQATTSRVMDSSMVT
jgi:hypothetical protein